MFVIGAVGLTKLKPTDPADVPLFNASIFFPVSLRSAPLKFTSQPSCFHRQMNCIGWNLIFVWSIVQDLRAKRGVAPGFRFTGWALFRASPLPSRLLLL